MTDLHELVSRVPRDRRFSDPGLPIAFGTVCGPIRSENQDFVRATQTGTDFSIVICDGVAGRPLGREAAEFVTGSALRTLSSGTCSPLERTRHAITRAHRSARFEFGGGPCTTLVCVSVIGARCVIGWVGDSRAYGIRDDGRIDRLTLDDTIQDHLAQHYDEPCPEVSTALIQAVGTNEEIQPNALEVGPGFRRIILVTDGAYRGGLAFPVNGTLDEAVGAILDWSDGQDNATAAVLDLRYQVKPTTGTRYLVGASDVSTIPTA